VKTLLVTAKNMTFPPLTAVCKYLYHLFRHVS